MGPLLFLLYNSELFSILENMLSSYTDDSTLMAVMTSPVVKSVPSAVLDRVSEWCDLWGMKLIASKTKTMIVSRSRTMHSQSPPLTIGGTLHKESDDLVILGVTFDSKMTFEMHLRSVSRAASQRLSILRKSLIDRFFGDAFGVLSCQFWSIVLQSGARLPKLTLNYWTEQSVVPGF